MNTGILMKKKLKLLQSWICDECGLLRGYMDPGVVQDATAWLECLNCRKAKLHKNTRRADTYAIQVPA